MHFLISEYSLHIADSSKNIRLAEKCKYKKCDGIRHKIIIIRKIDNRDLRNRYEVIKLRVCSFFNAKNVTEFVTLERTDNENQNE